MPSMLEGMHCSYLARGLRPVGAKRKCYYTVWLLSLEVIMKGTVSETVMKCISDDHNFAPINKLVKKRTMAKQDQE